MAVPLEQPRPIVPLDELPNHQPRFVERREVVEVEAFLFQRPDPALHDPVALRLADVARARPDPEPAQLTQELVRRVLRAPVHAEPQAERDLRGVVAVGTLHALADRLQRRPAVPHFRHVPPHDILDAVIDRAEEPAPALPLRVEARRIRAPELVGPGHDDRPRMRAIASGVLPARRREEVGHAHQPQHPCLADVDPPRPQPRPHLPVPLRVKRARLQHAADLRQQRRVIERGPRAALAMGGTGMPPPGPIVVLRAASRVVCETGLLHAPICPHPPPLRVHGRAAHPPGRAHQCQRVATPARRTHSPRDRFSLASSSPYPLFSRSISTSSSFIVSSPIFACACCSARSADSPLRRFSFASAPSKKSRRQASSSCAGTWISRLTVSTASPRNRRSTTSLFAFALQRSGSSSACSASVTTDITPTPWTPQTYRQITVQGNRGLYTTSNRLRWRFAFLAATTSFDCKTPAAA